MDSKLTYTVAEVAALLGISRGSAYEAARHGRLPTIRMGKRLLVPRVALQKILDQSCSQVITENPSVEDLSRRSVPGERPPRSNSTD